MGNLGNLGRIRLWHVAFFCGALFCAGLFIPTLTTATAQSSSKEDTYRQLGLFGDIFQRVRESYVDEIASDFSNAATNIIPKLCKSVVVQEK